MRVDEIYCGGDSKKDHGKVVFGVVYDPHYSDVAPASRKDDYVQALFDKTEFVMKDLEQNEGRFLVLTGDIFHKRTLSTKFMCRFVDFFTSFSIPTYGIAGNHDVYGGNVDFLDRTSLGIVFSAGVIRKLEHLLVYAFNFSMHLRGFDFNPALHVKTPAQEEVEIAYEAQHRLEGEIWDGLDIDWHMAVAHGFIKKSHANFETKDYVNVPSFGEAGYRALFLGHDHVPYPVEEVDGLYLCRGGNLSRGTKHRYQRIRDVQYHLVTVTKEGIKVEARKIPSASADDIYSEAQIEREDLNLQLKKFITHLQEKQERAESDDDIFSIIEGMEVPDVIKQRCFKYLGEAGIVRGQV